MKVNEKLQECSDVVSKIKLKILKAKKMLRAGQKGEAMRVLREIEDML